MAYHGNPILLLLAISYGVLTKTCPNERLKLFLTLELPEIDSFDLNRKSLMILKSCVDLIDEEPLARKLNTVNH